MLLDRISAWAQRAEGLLLRGGTIGLAHGTDRMFEGSSNTGDVVAGQ